jgi:mono/diheme cytochrome c family protein
MCCGLRREAFGQLRSRAAAATTGAMNHVKFAALVALAQFFVGLAGAEPVPASARAVATRYCVDCHGADAAKAGLNLEKLLPDDLARHSDAWEKVIRKLRARHMPPIGKPRPDEKTFDAVIAALEQPLDRAAAAKPTPGRTDTVRRLNRTEYQNAIRDLLALDVDAAALLPADEASHGFDNITVGMLSPTLLDRYLTAAQKIARLAVGGAQRGPGGDTYRVKPDITQEERVEGMPLGTRGGAVFRHTFPQDGDYEFQLRLTRDRNDLVEGLREPHQILVLLDGVQVHTFTVRPPPPGKGHNDVDTGLSVRLPVKAGPHAVGVTFLKNSASLLETARQPYNVSFNFHRHPRQSPALYQVSVAGPFAAKGAGDTPSRRRIFVAQPKSPGEEEACAKQILSTLLRRAWRRPVNDADVARVLKVFREARAEGSFDAGIEAALTAVLVSREFLFRVEQEPAGLASKSPYRVSDVELASRLSFFLWSSIPDDELLAVAERGELSRPAVLAQQTRRMLADPRAQSLVRNFASQWLHLRNLDSITPDGRLFPDFDDNLRQAMRRETELLFEEIVREDRSVLDLLRADHTFLNERLAKHYGIPHVFGERFRRDREHARAGVRARRAAAARERAHGHELRHAHVAGDSRQVDFGKPRRHAAPAAVARRARARRQHRVRQPARARAPRRAPRQRRVRELPRPDGPGGLRAGELRRRGPLAHAGGRQARGRDRRLPRWSEVHRRCRAGARAAQPPRAVRHRADGEAADLRARPRRGAVRCAGRAAGGARGES